MSHLGIELADVPAVEAARGRFAQSGGSIGREIVDEPDTVCCYARQSKFWIEDPDGNSWEFFTVLEDVPSRSSGCEC